jgi:diguanylate cyclase (GGDEF)-like protein
MLFFQHVFRNEISIWAVRSAVAVFCVLGAVILATDAVFFTMLGPAMIALVLLFGLYAIVPVTMALTRKRQGAALFLGGLVVLFLSVVNDFLFNTMLVDTTFLIPAGYSIGLFIFILSQSSVLALRFSSAFATVAELSRDLEKRVDERTAELQDERNKLAKIAIEDDLTGLYNRRYSLEYLKSEFYRFSRYGAVFSVLIIDLDHFKKVNDTYGHLAGDTLLREIGSVLKAMMRMSDVCGRFGGEEFIIVLPGTGMDAAAALAEKIRARIEALELTAGDSRYSVSCSIGLSQANGADGNYNVVLQRADSALYAAKDRGRNRVVCME